MVAEPHSGDAPEVCAAQSNSPPKRWIFDTGCTDHLSPNRSDFISYTPFVTPRGIRLGNASLLLSLGEGTVKLNCIVNGVTVKRTVENVQYVPGLIYGLLTGKSLNQKGIRIAVEDGGCKITHRNGTILAEALPTSGRLYFLNLASYPITPLPTTTALAATPSFDLIHKRLAHPGKDTLQTMIRKELVSGLKGVPDESKDFTCDAL